MTHARSESSNAVAATAATVDPAEVRFGRWAVLFCALALWGGLSWFLSAEWSLSEQYTYGWFVPLLAAGLFVLRWTDRPPARPPHVGGAGSTLIVACVLAALLTLPFLRLVEIANPDGRPLGWMHAILAAGLTTLGIWRAGGWPWLRHFLFPVAFFLVAVPWTRGVEDFVIQQLMRGVASLAVDVVALFGVPAQAEGNLIRIGAGVVGVNEACSGVRSLQTAIMFGLLLGELHRFSVLRRVTVLAGAVGVALLANTFRATYLVWVAADRGLAAVERQHDLIGYLILASVFLGTLGLAAWLKRGEAPSKIPPADPSPAPGVVPPAWILLAAGAWLVLAEIGVDGWFRWHERGLGSTPRWSVTWPTNAPGFREIAISESAERILRYDEGRGVSWSARAPGVANDRIIYFFRWKPGRNSAQLAADHRPDVCLPAAGLEQVAAISEMTGAADGPWPARFAGSVFSTSNSPGAGWGARKPSMCFIASPTTSRGRSLVSIRTFRSAAGIICASASVWRWPGVVISASRCCRSSWSTPARRMRRNGNSPPSCRSFCAFPRRHSRPRNFRFHFVRERYVLGESMKLYRVRENGLQAGRGGICGRRVHGFSAAWNCRPLPC